MKIYLDDDTDSNILIQLLLLAGFDVLSPRRLGMRHKKDHEHLLRATIENAALLTSNCNDFVKLDASHKKQKKEHNGIFLIFRDNNRKKDMTPQQIIKALQNFITLNLPIKNRCYKLNDFNY